jgi:hypothetical protein
VGGTFHSLTIRRYLLSGRSREAIYEYECSCGSVGRIRRQKIGKIKTCPACRRTTCGEISGCYWSSLRLNALARGIEFAVQPEDAWERYLAQGGVCALSGVVLFITRNTKKSRSGDQTASLDRLDGSKGYVKGNIQWVHKVVNLMRGRLSVDEFVQWCRAIVAHAGSGKGS